MNAPPSRAPAPHGGRIRFNAAANVIGTIVPLAVAVLTVPLLLDALGQARLGLFTLALALFAFAGVFDLGLGRTTILVVARARSSTDGVVSAAPAVARTLRIVVLVGVLCSAVLAIASKSLAVEMAGGDLDLQAETQRALVYLSLIVPAILASSVLTGVLEGTQEYGVLNAVRIPLGASTYLAPAIAALATASLADAVLALVIVRLVGTLVWGALVLRRLPILSHPGRALDMREVWQFSGWLSVSNLISPLLVTADRYYLAAIFPPAAVASYTVPFDAAYRLTVLPAAAVGVLFPHMAEKSSRVVGRSDAAVAKAGWLLSLLWVVPLTILGLFVEPILALWLGESFATESSGIARWLLAGVVLNGVALVPYTHLHASGRADVTARIHCLELPIYALLLVYMTHLHGLEGAAVAWTLRVGIDVCLLAFAAAREGLALRGDLAAAGVVAALSAVTIMAGKQPLIASITGAMLAVMVVVSGSSMRRRSTP